ncbi:hypothetical protein BGX28_007103, partial [Mortierella sp. GBA30]
MQALSLSQQIAAVIVESASYIGALPFPATVAASRSHHVRSATSAVKAAAPKPAASSAVGGGHGQAYIPECLRLAADEGILSLSTLHQAVAALERDPKAVTLAQIEMLTQKVQ